MENPAKSSWTVILIPVPEADHIVRPVAEETSPHRSSPMTVAHISLSDFLPADRIDGVALAGLASFFDTVAPFDVTLDRVERFSSGLAYLAPEPRAEFDALIARLTDRHPDTPPYGGQFDVVIPHMSLYLPNECTEGDLEAVRATLPIRFRASEARLVEYTTTTSRDLASFPLGHLLAEPNRPLA